jgi:hypothetical protein
MACTINIVMPLEASFKIVRGTLQFAVYLYKCKVQGNTIVALQWGLGGGLVEHLSCGWYYKNCYAPGGVTYNCKIIKRCFTIVKAKVKAMLLLHPAEVPKVV